MRYRVALATLLAAGTIVLGSGPALGAAKNPGETPAKPVVSNMGLCSPFLGQLGVRPEVNRLVRELGPFLPDGPFDNTGELYRLRAQQHPNATAEQECLAR
jgi:hypothetical protein